MPSVVLTSSFRHSRMLLAGIHLEVCSSSRINLDARLRGHDARPESVFTGIRNARLSTIPEQLFFLFTSAPRLA